MGSRKHSARAREREKFLSGLGGMDDAFAAEEAHQREAADQKEEARLMKACLSKQRYGTRAEAEETARACAQHGTYGLEVLSCNLLVDSGTAGTGSRYALPRCPPTSTRRLERRDVGERKRDREG